MVTLKKSPRIYEINAWTWLADLSRTYGEKITLATIPAQEFAKLGELEIDAIWLMGIWERSPYGVKIALEHSGLQQDYRKALPNVQPEDVVGSPYAVRRYTIDPNLGDLKGLSLFRETLAKHDLSLILDFVPNHVACDHEWTLKYPEAFVAGTPQDILDKPDYFFQVDEYIYANGRDPYFPAWTDVAQLNAFSAKYRELAIQTLCDIAELCDGVRCDMAMLLVNKIFTNTWGERVGEAPDTEFWQAVIPAVHENYPDFAFIGEVYWDMEAEMIRQGFDYCYDKRLYDRLLHENATSINQHLQAELEYQNHLVRFIENHDEARAITAFGEERVRAAAVLVATLPGAKLWHEGQFEGYRIKLPVQLGRRPAEKGDKKLDKFYNSLLKQVSKKVYQQGEWQLRHIIRAWPENESYQTLIAYTWRRNDKHRLIVINYANHRSQGRVMLRDFDLEGTVWLLTDLLNDKTYERGGNEMAEAGLYIDLLAWGAHIFKFEPA